MNRSSAPCRRLVLEQRHELVVIDSAHDHRVDLQAAEFRGRGLDGLEHRRVLVEPRQGFEARRIQRIEAHRDALQARPLQRNNMSSQQHAVRRHREILNGRTRGQSFDQQRQVAAEEWFSTRDADAVHTGVGEDIHERGDLLEAQHLVSRQPDVVVFGHAVLTAQIAAVSHRDPQAPQGPPESIRGHHQANYPRIFAILGRTGSKRGGNPR